MKKFLIHFISADTPSIEDDGIGCGVNGGILMEEGSNNKVKLFDSKEEADKYLEEVLIPEDQANLEECYGITDEPELADNYEFSVENGSYGRKQLTVYDVMGGCAYNELNTTIYEVVEVEF
jgi:hypothetical protein